jgi:hypothetical protein
VDWKTELIKQLDQLKDRPLGIDPIGIGVWLDHPDPEILWNLQRHALHVNSRPITWVGAGYLQLRDVSWEPGSGWIVFQLSPARKFNECFVEDVLTGQVSKCELPLYGEVDFLAL